MTPASIDPVNPISTPEQTNTDAPAWRKVQTMSDRDRTHDTILLDEPFMRMTHSRADQLIHLEWRGHARSDNYRRGLDLALNFVMKNDVRRWLADLRNMTAILQADEKWTDEVWFPKLFNTGLEKMAILPSSDYFNQTSVQRIITAASGPSTFQIAWFETSLEAIDWLSRKEALSA